MRTSRSAILAGVIGLAVVVAIATALGKPAADTIELISIAGGAALVTGGLGAVALQLLRGRSFSAQVVVVALTSTAAVTAGALAAGNAMFLETQDLETLAVVVSVGAVVAIVAALLLGNRVGRASRMIGEAVHKLSDPDAVFDGDEVRDMPPTMIREFTALVDQLAQTRRELEESRERERAIDRARRELVSWVSHDLRTPLSGIRAVTELLEDDILDDPAEIKRYYRTLRNEADKLAALVGDLFEVSKIEAGAVRLEFEDINLSDLVADTQAALSPVADQRGITIHSRGSDPLAVVQASLPEVSRILRNLVSNGVRESRDGGAVFIQAGHVIEDGEATAVITVQDTCGGIPEHVIDRVFEASYRGEHARTPRTDGGAGLGLAIARGFAEAHGGSISVQNVAEGCRFTVRLPVMQSGDRSMYDHSGSAPEPPPDVVAKAPDARHANRWPPWAPGSAD